MAGPRTQTWQQDNEPLLTKNLKLRWLEQDLVERI